MDLVQSTALSGSVGGEMSVWALFLDADIIVKVVMVMLLLASAWCWTIIFDKWFRLRGLFRRANHFEETFWSGGSLDELYDRIGARPLDPMSSIFVAAMREWRRATSKGLADGEMVRGGWVVRVHSAHPHEFGRALLHAVGGVTVVPTVADVLHEHSALDVVGAHQF